MQPVSITHISYHPNRIIPDTSYILGLLPDPTCTRKLEGSSQSHASSCATESEAVSFPQPGLGPLLDVQGMRPWLSSLWDLVVLTLPFTLHSSSKTEFLCASQQVLNRADRAISSPSKPVRPANIWFYEFKAGTLQVMLLSTTDRNLLCFTYNTPYKL